MGNGFGVNTAFVLTGAEPRSRHVTLNILVAFFKSTTSVLAQIIRVPQLAYNVYTHKPGPSPVVLE